MTNFGTDCKFYKINKADMSLFIQKKSGRHLHQRELIFVFLNMAVSILLNLVSSTYSHDTLHHHADKLLN